MIVLREERRRRRKVKRKIDWIGLALSICQSRERHEPFRSKVKKTA